MIAVDLRVSTSEAGLLVTVFALGAAIVAPILIALTINMERKKLLMAALSVFIISNGLMPVHLWVLIADALCNFLQRSICFKQQVGE